VPGGAIFVPLVWLAGPVSGEAGPVFCGGAVWLLCGWDVGDVGVAWGSVVPLVWLVAILGV
jgi:hypothetical protein